MRTIIKIFILKILIKPNLRTFMTFMKTNFENIYLNTYFEDFH